MAVLGAVVGGLASWLRQYPELWVRARKLGGVGNPPVGQRTIIDALADSVRFRVICVPDVEDTGGGGAHGWRTVEHGETFPRYLSRIEVISPPVSPSAKRFKWAYVGCLVEEVSRQYARVSPKQDPDPGRPRALSQSFAGWSE